MRRQLIAQQMKQADKRTLGQLYWGSKENQIFFQGFQSRVAQNPITAFDPSHLGLGRKQLFEKFMIKTVQSLTLGGRKITQNQVNQMFQAFNQQLALGIHFKLFIQTLKNLCNQKQADHFIKKALSFQMLGCYAQTELGHGSDVQSLQTTAHYDSARQEFIINSPTISSTKWWIGQLGFICTHTIVFAQLFINDKKYGIHAFLVPIRNEENKLLPGIRAGDIGPKYGFINKDNGFARFSNVRIPRQNMLMRFAKVNSKGVYSRQGDERISYATMLVTRAFIGTMCSNYLAKAVTIVLRYSHFRSQFKDQKGADIKLIDYQLQKNKIYPHMAQAYAFAFASQQLALMLDKNIQAINEKNDFRLLNDCHALSSGIKAIFTWKTFFAIQKLRRACGGHGFSSYSGLPNILSQFSPCPTYQGQNTVLMLQLGRYLIKSYERCMKGKSINQTVQYLMQQQIINVKSKSQFLTSQNLINLLKNDAKMKVQRAAMKLLKLTSQGMPQIKAWNRYVGNIVVQASTAHINFWTVWSFIKTIGTIESTQLQRVLSLLLKIFAVNLILETTIISRLLTRQVFVWLDQAKIQLLDQLAPYDNDLVDGFGYHPNSLGSAFGWKDGKGYERLLEWARNHNPLNSEQNVKEIRTLLKENTSQIQFKAKL